MKAMLALAKMLAEEAGREIMRRRSSLSVSYKKDNTVVTDADLASDAILRKGLLEEFPDHTYESEEAGVVNPGHEYHWLIDPLDGTQNYSRGLPFFNVSVALLKGNEVIMGVVHAPIFNETYWSVKGGASNLNGQPLHVSTVNKLSDGMLILDTCMERGLIAEGHKWFYDGILPKVRRMRFFGAAALEICFAAAGRFDACLYNGLYSYDFAAASLILQNAGGRLTNFHGKFDLGDRCVLASNGLLHDELLTYVRD
jgi:myo-inositol-1(or 4)-monophosphatase